MASQGNTNQPIGVIIVARHGDRSGFYQNLTDYTASDTVLTALGMQQEYQLGQYLRSRYINASSPDNIQGVSQVIDDTQIVAVADAGSEGSVIDNSAQALLQGLYPPTANATTTLANGSTITAPLGGFQYVQLDTLLPAFNNSLEGFTSCPNFTTHTNTFFNSEAFAQKESQVTNFLAELGTTGLLGNRTVALKNAYNVWDYMNVNSIHDATYNSSLQERGGVQLLGEMRAIADWQQYYTFSDPDPSSVGMVAINNFLPLLIDSLSAITTSANPVKLVHYEISYKPFLSFFNLTNMAATSMPNPYSMVDYASAMTFEVRVNAAGTGHDVRFSFKNGTNDESLVPYPLFGSSDVDYDLNALIEKFNATAVRGELAWCQLCNSTSPACQTAISAASASSSTLRGDGGLSNAASGAIGAVVTLALAAVVFGAAWLLGYVSVGKGRSHHQRLRDDQSATGWKHKDIEL